MRILILRVVISAALLSVPAQTFAQVPVTGSLAGTKSADTAAPSSDNLSVMPAIVCTSARSYTTGRVNFPCMDATGPLWVSIYKPDGTAVTYIANGQATKANSQPVTMASDQPPVPGTLQKGVITSAMTGTTSTSLVAAVASNYLYITSCSFSNDHASTSTSMLLQDGSGGTTLWKGLVPFGGGREVTFPAPLKVPTLGNGLFVANVTTSSSTYASCSGYASTVSF